MSAWHFEQVWIRPLAWLLFTGLCLCALPAASASFNVGKLTCEYLAEPLGLDVGKPRLSWQLIPTGSNWDGLGQQKYRILVATSKSLLKPGKADLWDSGVVQTDQSVLVEYGGKPLGSDLECWWKVEVTDQKGGTAWSPPARWTMGVLDAADWHGKWIGSSQEPPHQGSNLIDPRFSKQIMIPARPLRAVIHVASVGYQEVMVNGHQVPGILEPGIADYNHRARYRTYEIGPWLKKGQNKVAIGLGTGWSIYPDMQTDMKFNRPCVTGQGRVWMEGGQSLEFKTDSSWAMDDGASRLLGDFGKTNFGGEWIDGRRVDLSWEDAEPKAGLPYGAEFQLSRQISAEVVEPNLVAHVLKPAKVERTGPNSFRADMGRNFVGWVEFPVVAKPGTTVVVEWSERKDKQETYGLKSEYLVGPTGKGTFRNKFNYGSGRWITVTGMAEPPEWLKGLQIRTGYQRASGFECSNPLLNQIYDTTLWTFENLSLGGYIVDCPQRERRGYGGDGHSTTQAGLDNYGMGAFYTKWIQDWRDVQAADGSLPNTAPTYSGGGGPAWGGFSIHLPWMVYRQYGDRRILRENFPMMRRWLASIASHAKEGLLQPWGDEWTFLGDWVWPYDEKVAGVPNSDSPDTLFFNNCYWAYALRSAASVADAIGETSAALGYRRQAEALCTAIQAKWYRPATHDYANGRQNNLALALIGGVPPAELRPLVMKRLEEEILVHRKGHIDAGITGGALLTRLLIEENRPDLMMAMATKKDYPSWGEFLKRGETTWPETWDDLWWSSKLHSSFLCIGAWIMEGLAGIRPGPDGGFQTFELRPFLGAGLTSVNAHYDSGYGRISVSWKVSGAQAELRVTVPPNTKAVLHLKNHAKEGITLAPGRHEMKVQLANGS